VAMGTTQLNALGWTESPATRGGSLDRVARGDYYTVRAAHGIGTGTGDCDVYVQVGGAVPRAAWRQSDRKGEARGFEKGRFDIAGYWTTRTTVLAAL